MIKNYLLISFRSLKKHFSYSLINILGLGLGLATCLLLVTWIRHELSFDTFHEKASRIYRFSLEYGNSGQVASTSVSPTALMPAILSLPEAEAGVRYYKVSGRNPWIVRHGEATFRETKFYVADSSFFDIFSFQLLKGNPSEALRQPYSVVLTESIAKKYFGNDDPLGKLLKVNNKREYVVTGVVADLPNNSFFKFDLLASFTSLPPQMLQTQWWSANYQTFILVKDKANIDDLEAKTNAIVKKEITMGDGGYVKYNKIALTDIYLKSPYANEPEVVSDIRYVYIFSAVALLILLIACINYINLATAKAADRAKEVGIRKVVGALRKQLFLQFIGESVLITFFAFVFAFLLSQLLLPLFNELTGKHFSNGVLLEPSFLLTSIGVLLTIAILAGAYPAFAITSFKPVTVLKGNFKTSGRGIWLRKGLVVFQFSISIILIAGTIIIVRQLDYIQGKNLGYDKERVIHMPLDSVTQASYPAFKNELERTGHAVGVGRGSESPVQIQAGYSINTKENSSSQGVVITGLIVDKDYIPTVGLELLYGRNFTEADWERNQKDTVYAFILNESALKALFLEPSESLGKVVDIGGRSGEIIGVAKDFHFTSLHREINPLMIFQQDQLSKIFIRLPEGDVEKHLAEVQDIYSKLYTHRPFEYQFLDEQYQTLYDNEQRLGSVFVVFATLAIIIACLGLLGLVSFSASQKTKEIGIRKVMGATPGSIVVLITSDFTKLVFVSIVIGLQLAYYVMTQWLSAFAYKIDIGFVPLAVAAIIAMVIALGTAGYQAVKAAMVDPAKTLRNE